MARPRKDSDKLEIDRRTREFVVALRAHSPHLSLAELERQLGLEVEFSPGKTLGRWGKAGQPGGRGTTMDRLQWASQKAIQVGLLPALRKSGVVRHDPVYVNADERASEILASQLKQGRDLHQARAAAVAALAAYASAIEGAADWVVVDQSEDSELTGRNELRGADVLSLGRQLEAHAWTFTPRL